MAKKIDALKLDSFDESISRDVLTEALRDLQLRVQDAENELAEVKEELAQEKADGIHTWNVVIPKMEAENVKLKEANKQVAGRV